LKKKKVNCKLSSLAYAVCGNKHPRCVSRFLSQAPNRCPTLAKGSLKKGLKALSKLKKKGLSATRVLLEGTFNKNDKKKAKKSIQQLAKSAFNRLFKGLTKCVLVPKKVRKRIHTAARNIRNKKSFRRNMKVLSKLNKHLKKHTKHTKGHGKHGKKGKASKRHGKKHGKKGKASKRHGKKHGKQGKKGKKAKRHGKKHGKHSKKGKKAKRHGKKHGKHGKKRKNI